MNLKAKGSKAERELLHLFWEAGWACTRTAGSGSTTRPAPDLLAGNGEIVLALECKAFSGSNKYFEKNEIEQLETFSNIFGAESRIAIKFSRKPWYFVKIADLKNSGKNFGINLKLCEEKGQKFEELTSNDRKI
jgi:holliday junction resolvase Hjr